MTGARTWTCPSCGAAVDEQARSCTYCRAAVATVRCARCFHMNVPDAVHCSGCGEKLGLEPIAGDGNLTCPDCKAAMSTFSGEHGALHDCGKCGGQFVDNDLLRALLERREVIGEAVPGEMGRPVRTQTAVRYLPCPACKAFMNRKNFGDTSGVIVDVCKKDGMWFDSGELPRILSFVEGGGLARARRAAEEEALEERKEAVARAAALLVADANDARNPRRDPVTDILDFLRAALR